MLAEKEFKNISKIYDCEYIHDSYKVAGDIGSFIYISKHYLKINYNNSTVNIVYDFGNYDTAEYRINIETERKIPKFSLDTIDHFSKLITFKKEHTVIKTESSKFKSEINQLLRENKLTTLIKETSFEPSITGKMNEIKYEILTRFSLKFEGKIASIQKIIKFHIGLIDLVKH